MEKIAAEKESPIFVPSVTTRFFALFGNPLGFTASPWMHNHVFRKLGMDCLYSPYEIPEDGLETVVKNMGAFHIAGANVTMPFKAKVSKYLDALAESARTTEVVNTISVDADGKKTGHNTDGEGFVRSLSDQMRLDVPNLKYVLFGTGGAASAIACSLASKGVRTILTLCRDESSPHVENFRKHLDAHFPGVCTIRKMTDASIRDGVAGRDVIINATKVGMFPKVDDVLFDTSVLGPDHVVCDVIYNPKETRLLVEAKKRGCRTLSGLWMLVYQGAEAFRLWTGVTPPTDYMFETACRFFTKRA